VEFFSSTQEALLHGYRPCKVCKPLSHENETPELIAGIIDELSKDPFLKIKDVDLVKRGIQPSHIRRWFKKHHDITFHAFQRMLRINTAFQKMADGDTITGTAFDTGYASLSGFNHGFQKIFGKAPSKAAHKSIINISRFTTPLGPMYACASDKGICLLEFTNRRMLENEFKDLIKRLDAVILPGKNPFLDQAEKEILEYFEGKRKHFSVPLHTPGTEFQNAVWKILQDIPYGETRSYKMQAQILGKPQATRAVASANGMNRVAIIIPCHRVIGEDGSLTGYAGGLAKKRWLLDHERMHSGKAVQGEIGFN
jgi:AraC family transcriptional regulator of adaptative response/methylated-DNA-[protein]-cysteine methyltransferase